MRKFLAIFFTITLVTPFLIATLIALPIRGWMFNRQFYYQSFSGEKLIEILQTSNLPTLTNTTLPVSTEIVDAFFISLTKVVTPEYLESQLHPVIDNGLKVLEGQKDTIDVTVDLVPLKAAIQGNKKEEFLSTFAINFPECENNEEPSLSQMLVICRPPSVSTEDFAENLLEPILPQLIKMIPDEYPLKLPFKLSLQNLFFWTPLIPNLSLPGFLTGVLIISTSLTLAFWILTALLSDTTWRIRFKWLGGSLIFPALVVLLLAGFVYLLTIGNILNWFLDLFGIQLGLITGLLSIISYFITKVALSFLISGSIALGVAIAFVVLGNLISPGQIEQD